MKFMTILSFLILSALAIEPISAITFVNAISMTETLTDRAEDYIAFLNRIGTKQPLPDENGVLQLCTPQCKKTVNGTLCFEGAEHLVPHLISMMEKAGNWTAQPIEIIPGKNGRSVVISLLIRTEKMGDLYSIVILHCNTQILITEINEVFNSYEATL